MTDTKVTVGIVGVGKIGMALARKLLAAGYDVIGIARSEKPEFVSAGGRFADSIEQIGSEAEFILLTLSSREAVLSCVEHLYKSCREGQVIIDLTGYALSVKQSIAERFSELGVVHLDCEMSGLPTMVTDGTATIMQSGPREAVDRAQDVFDAMVSRTKYLGEFGSASKMKLMHNILTAIHNSVAAEVINLAQMSGLDPGLVVETLGPSAGGSKMLSVKGPIMVSREFDQGAGPFRTMTQYLRRALKWSEQVGASTPLLDATFEYYERAEQEGRDNQDIAAIIEMLEAADK